MPKTTDARYRFKSGGARVAVYQSAAEAGAAAAVHAAGLIRAAIAKQGHARVIGATGNSQIPLVDALVHEDLDWKAVELFHMDEYVGLPADHPASFRHWIKTRLEDRVHPGATHYIHGDAVDLKAEIARYAGLLLADSIDVALVGFGENGHIAFNDPPLAAFNDKETLKVVTLDEACRRQQAGEGHFRNADSVPSRAVTITCPGLFRAKNWVCCVPESRKAEAVQNALEGSVSERCPASLVQRHGDASVYLDAVSAARLASLANAAEIGTVYER